MPPPPHRREATATDSPKAEEYSRGVPTRAPAAVLEAVSSLMITLAPQASPEPEFRIQNSESAQSVEPTGEKNQNSEFRIQNSEPETLMPRHIRHAPEFRIQNSEQQPARRRAAHSTQNSEFRIQDFAARPTLRIHGLRIQSSEFRLGPPQRVHALNQNSEFRIRSMSDVETRKRGRIQSSEFIGGHMGELRGESRDKLQNSKWQRAESRIQSSELIRIQKAW